MIWILTVPFCVLLVEIALRLPIPSAAAALKRTTAKSMATMRSAAISDHWKEKAIGAYAARTVRATGTLALSILALCAAALGLAWIIGAILGRDYLAFLVSPAGLVGSLVIACGYAWFRLQGATSEDGEYSATDKLLHRLALGSSAIAEMSFDMDQSMNKTDGNAVHDGAHVFVTGLARSGTTVLMRRLHASGQFRSLTYRDMPFVLAPRLWARVTGRARQDQAAKERAHGDRLAVSADSPEALDEVFWKVFAGDDYIGDEDLRPHTPDDEILAKFKRYVSAILSQGEAKRYLSKNNNNILRLDALVQAFPNAAILIPFRDPVAHAGSLLQQHRRFSQMHADDPFGRSYMTWLAHHEFGTDHRRFRVRAGSTADPDTLEYWLDLWCDVYEFVLTEAPHQAIFVSYDALCADHEVWLGLARTLGIPADVTSDGGFRASPRDYAGTKDSARAARAADVHARLMGRAEV